MEFGVFVFIVTVSGLALAALSLDILSAKSK